MELKFGNRVTDVKMRSSRWGPNPTWLVCLKKREIWTRRPTWEETMWIWRWPSTTQGERTIPDSPSQLSECTNPAGTSISDLWPPELEGMNFCCFSPPVCGTLLQKPKSGFSEEVTLSYNLTEEEDSSGEKKRREPCAEMKMRGPRPLWTPHP